MTEETKSENLLNQISELKVTNKEAEANDLLSQGWILLSVGKGQEQTNTHTFYPYLKFCLGKIYP